MPGAAVSRPGGRGARWLAWATGLAVVLWASGSAADPAEPNGWTVSGMIFAGLGAGALSAAATPVVVDAAARMVGEEEEKPVFARHLDPRPFLVGGGLALGLGLVLWAQGAPRVARYRDEHGILQPRVVHTSPGMRKAGIGVTAGGLGLLGLAVAVAYLPGNCNDSNPPECTYPNHDWAAAMALTGVAGVGVGVPLWVFGSEKVPAPGAPSSAEPRQAASLVLTLGGVALRASL